MKCDHPQSFFILFKLAQTKKQSFPKKLVVRGIWNHTKKATNFISLKKNYIMTSKKKYYILDKGGILLCIIKLFFYISLVEKLCFFFTRSFKKKTNIGGCKKFVETMF